MLHDAHNHLQDEALGPHVERILAAWPDCAGREGRQVVNGTRPADWPRVAALAARHSCVRAAYGVHPWQAGAAREAAWLEELERRLDADPRASVGEIGLDRWILDGARPDEPILAGLRRAPLAEQAAVFLPQFALAAAKNRAVTLHCLRAFAELLPLLRAHARPARGFLLHAFGGPAELVPELLELGAYFSFNPAFLAPKKTRQREVFRALPMERLLCETDAPGMAPPQAWRTHKLPPARDGSPLNHPGNIEAAYAGLAALRGEDAGLLAARVAENFARLFGE